MPCGIETVAVIRSALDIVHEMTALSDSYMSGSFSGKDRMGALTVILLGLVRSIGSEFVAIDLVVDPDG